jgi:RND family efflux transporter MFP subunit
MIQHNLESFRGALCQGLAGWIVAGASTLCLAAPPTQSSEPLSDALEGFTEPLQTIDVAASELGIVTRVLVKEGQQVVQGELLAELDNDVLQSTLHIAQARAAARGNSDAAKAERDLRKDRLEQLEKLMTKGHATEGELARARADAAVAEARVQVADEEQRMAELECRRIQTQIDRRRIRSPIAGLVAEVHREPGEAFLAGDPRIVTLVNVSQLRVRFQTTAQQAVALAAGQSVEVHLSDLNQTMVATIERVSPIMDAKSGTVEVTVILDNSQSRRALRSGMRCTWQIGRFHPVPPADAPTTTRKVSRQP